MLFDPQIDILQHFSKSFMTVCELWWNVFQDFILKKVKAFASISSYSKGRNGTAFRHSYWIWLQLLHHLQMKLLKRLSKITNMRYDELYSRLSYWGKNFVSIYSHHIQKVETGQHATMVNMVGKCVWPGKNFQIIFQKPRIWGMVECVSSFDIER